MTAGFDPLVHIDWKTPGGEWLALLPPSYPHIPVLCGPAFEALLDELCNEMPEVCFDALATALAREGFDLWNLDAGGDDYRPVIVPTNQRERFARHWREHNAAPRFTPTLIEAQTPPARPPRRSKLKWLQDVHDYPGPTSVHAYNYRNGWAAITEQDEDRWLCFLIDYNPWPPTEQDMLEARDDGVDGADLQLIDANVQHSLWKRQVTRGAYGSDDRYQYEIRQGDAVEGFGPAQIQWPAFEEPCVVVDGQIYERQRLYDPEPLTRIWRITAQTSEVIFEHPDELTLLPIGPNRLLFMQHNGPQCWICNQAPRNTPSSPPNRCRLRVISCARPQRTWKATRYCCSAKAHGPTANTRAIRKPCCWRGASTSSPAPAPVQSWTASAANCARTRAY